MAFADEATAKDYRAAWDAWRDLLGDKVQWDPSPLE